MDLMKKIFKREIKHPDKRNIYAVVTGDYVGEMFIYIDEQEEVYRFLSIPKNINRVVPKEKFEFARNNSIIEFVEVAPRLVHKVAVKQFYYNENSNN
jgi:hypothetical protein